MSEPNHSEKHTATDPTREGQSSDPKYFSAEARKWIESQGNRVFPAQMTTFFQITGKIDYMRDDNLLVFNKEVSRGTQFAVNRAELFLPNSFDKSIREQEDLLARYNERLMAEISGVRAIRGNIVDYALIADSLGNQVNNPLNDNYVRLTTKAYDERIGTFAVRFLRLGRLVMHSVFTPSSLGYDKQSDIGIIPILVPA